MDLSRGEGGSRDCSESGADRMAIPATKFNISVYAETSGFPEAAGAADGEEARPGLPAPAAPLNM